VCVDLWEAATDVDGFFVFLVEFSEGVFEHARVLSVSSLGLSRSILLHVSSLSTDRVL
jgi:hypothetical protein